MSKRALKGIGVALVLMGVVLVIVFGVAYKNAYDEVKVTEMMIDLSSGVQKVIYYGALEDCENAMNLNLVLTIGSVCLGVAGAAMIVSSNKREEIVTEAGEENNFTE